MAKQRSLFGNLFNEAGPIQAVIDGMAIGLGGPDRRKEAMVEAEKRRNEQQRAVEAGEKARLAAIKNTPPAEVPVEMPEVDSQLAELLKLNGQNAGNAVIPGATDPNVATSQGLASANIPSLFGDTTALRDPAAIGPIPTSPPLRTPVEQAGDYLREVKSAPLNPEGQKKLIRLKQIHERANSPELLPHQQKELMDQFFQEKERLAIEDDIEQPPTVESETQLRVKEAPNGMQTIMQPDGRIDVKDPTTKAELKQIELQAKAQDAEIQQRTQIQQMREQRRAEQMQVRQQEMAKQREVEAKVAEERATKFKEHWTKAIEKVPMSTRYEEARKELEAQYKSLNPKLPMRKFSPSEIRALAESKIAIDFSANERFADEPMKKAVKSPEDRIREMIRTDPDGFKESFEMKREELAASGEEPSREAVFAALMADTPESLEQEFESFLSQSNRPSTEAVPQPSGADMFVSGQDMLAPQGFLKGLFQKQSAQPQPASEDTVEPPSDAQPDAPVNPLRTGQEEVTLAKVPDQPDELALDIASKFQMDPSQVTEEDRSRELKDRFDNNSRQLLQGAVMKIRDQSPVIQSVEAALAKKLGQDVDFGSIIDPDAVGHFHKQGSKSPIEDAAAAIQKSIESGTVNINLLSTMQRDTAKRRYPLIESDKSEAYEKLPDGARYRTPTGDLMKKPVKQGKVVPRTSTPTEPRKDLSKRTSRTSQG